MNTKRLQQLAGILKEGYMGPPYDSSEDMAVDMIKKGITGEGGSWHPDDPASVDLDDREEDPDDYDDVSENEADSESGNTDAMGGINEEEPKGVVISVPENTSYVDLAKAVASELRDGYGKHLYKDFLKALVVELA